MSLQTNSSNLWICRLGYQDMADWSRGLLDLKARALGVKGWIAPIAVDKQGDFIEPLWNRQNNGLRAAPCLDLQCPLSPCPGTPDQLAICKARVDNQSAPKEITIRSCI